MKLRDLPSVLKVPDDQNSPISLLHPSFRDFLLSQERCRDPLFWVDKKIANQHLAGCCLERLSCGSTGLKRDICELKRHGVLTAEVDRSVVTLHLPAELQYACQYWVYHLQQGDQHHRNDGPVSAFLRQHLLHWFEALSLIGRTPQGVDTIALLESTINVSYPLRMEKI